EVVHADFFSYDALRPEFVRCDACFFCLGVTSIGLDERTYTHLTYDLTLTAASAMSASNPQMTFCYVSGAGTDDSGRARAMWARVKGRTENAILALPFKAAFMFRPGYIQPVKSARSKTAWVQALYSVVAPFYPVFRRVAPKQFTSTEAIGKAMIQVAAAGYSKPILHSSDMSSLAAA